MPPPLVTLDGIDVTLNGKTLLHRLSWRLRAGEHWAVQGPNGSGKSTFLRLVRGELWPDPRRGSRAYALDGIEQTTAVGVKEAMACVSPELQQRYLQQEWNLTGRQVVESGFGGSDYVLRPLTSPQRKRAARLARTLGVAGMLARNVQELSTGELRRLLVARALVGAPRVLVCDEICDGLDEAARTGLIETLDKVARNGTQLLFTTHRAGEMPPAITHRLVLERGGIVECAPLTRTDRTGRPAKASAVRQTRWGSDASQTRSSNGRVLLRVRNATVYLGPRRVLRDVNWVWRAGEHWAVLGPNGAGKSTFLKLIHGDLHPAWGGRVTRLDFTARHSLWEAKRRIGYVSPDLQARYREEITGADVIGSGFFSSVGRTRPLSARQRRRVDEIVKRLGLESLGSANAVRLSYGEFRKLLLARALVHEPELLMFDEPFDGLDAGSRRSIGGLLENVAAGGTSLLVVTHHPGDLPACTTHIARLSEGRITFQGPWDA